jgi:hypothetical protein
MIEKSDNPRVSKPMAGSRTTDTTAPAIRLKMKTTATELFKRLSSFSVGRWVITVLPMPKVQKVERIVAIATNQLRFPYDSGWISSASSNQKAAPSKRAASCADATQTNPLSLLKFMFSIYFFLEIIIYNEINTYTVKIQNSNLKVQNYTI